LSKTNMREKTWEKHTLEKKRGRHYDRKGSGMGTGNAVGRGGHFKSPRGFCRKIDQKK